MASAAGGRSVMYQGPDVSSASSVPVGGPTKAVAIFPPRDLPSTSSTLPFASSVRSKRFATSESLTSWRVVLPQVRARGRVKITGPVKYHWDGVSELYLLRVFVSFSGKKIKKNANSTPSASRSPS